MNPSRTKSANETPHWLDHPANVKKLWRGFLVVLALTVLAQAAVHMHPHFAIESIFGFNAWFGFLACAAMIGAAKLLALVLKRPDTYYDEVAEPTDKTPAQQGSAAHEH